MGLYLPPELRWLGWVAGTSWPDGDEDGMWALSDDWKAVATALTSQEPLVLKAKQDTEEAYPAGAGADAMGAHFDELIDGDHSVKALVETLNAVAESTFDMGTQLQATKITIIASLCWLAMEIAWAWLFPPTAPAAEAAGVATTRSFLKIVEDYVQNAIERLAGDLGASTMKNRYFWRELVTGGKLIMPSAKGFGVYAVKAVEGAGMSAAMDGAVQLGQIASGKRHGFDWKEFGVSIGASVAGSIPGREVARYAGDGIDKLFGNELKKMNIPLGSWTYPAGSVLRGGAIGVVSGATSTLFGDMVAAAAYGPSAFSSPAGWVGGMARGGIAGAARGTFVKSTPPAQDDVRYPAWMKNGNFSTTNRVTRTSGPSGTTPVEGGGGLGNAGTGGGQRNSAGEQEAGQNGRVVPAAGSSSRAGGTSLDDASSTKGGIRAGGTSLDDASSTKGGIRGGGTSSDGSSVNRGGGTFLDDASSVNGGGRGGGTSLDDASVNGGGRGGQGERSWLNLGDDESAQSSFGDGSRSVAPSEHGSEGGSHDSVLSYYFNHAGGGDAEVPPAPVRSTVEPPNSFQSSVDGGWTPPNRAGGAEEGLQTNPPETVRPGDESPASSVRGPAAAQPGSSTLGIRSGVEGEQGPAGSVRSGVSEVPGPIGTVGGGRRAGESFLDMDGSSDGASSVRSGVSEVQGPLGGVGGGRRAGGSLLDMDGSSDGASSVRGPAGAQGNGGSGGGVRAGVGEEHGPAVSVRGGGGRGDAANPEDGGPEHRPEQFLGKATDMKAKTRPKREPEWAPLPGPFEAPIAPSAADWLPGASGAGAGPGATGPDTTGPGGTGPDGGGSGATGPGATGPDGNPSGTNPTGTNPTGTDPTGTDPTGTDPTGTDPTGSDPGGTDPGTENDVRSGISEVDVPFNLGGNNNG